MLFLRKRRLKTQNVTGAAILVDSRNFLKFTLKQQDGKSQVGAPLKAQKLDVFKIHPGLLFIKNSRKSVKTPKRLVLRRMESLVFELPLLFLLFKKTRYNSDITSKTRIEFKKLYVDIYQENLIYTKNENFETVS